MTNYTIPLKPFYFIRHGQTDWNHGRRLMGQNDIPLNQHGVNQAQEVASYFKSSSHLIGKIISSSLLRAKKTAEIINNAIDTPLTYHDGLKEVSFGAAEGELEGYENRHSSWVKGVTPKGAESWIEFQHRILSSMISLLNNDDSKIPLIVSHGGVYAAIMDHFGHPNHNADNCVPYFFTPPSSPDQGWSILNLISQKTLSSEIATYEDL